MNIETTLIDHRNATPQLADFFMQQLIPLYQKYWDEQLKSLYDEPFNLQFQTLINMWLGGVIKIFTVRDDLELVGFATALVYRPVTYNNLVFQIQDFYCPNDVARTNLMTYLLDTVKILDCTEIQSPVALDLVGHYWHEMPDLPRKRYRFRS